MRAPFPRKASASLGVGLTFIAVSFLASIAYAAFLFPYLQILLVLSAVPGTLCGLIAGWGRSRLGAVASVTALSAIYAACNFDGDAGVRTAVQMHLLGIVPPNVRYSDTWWHLFHALVIPLNFGVALVACELMGRRRRSGDLPACEECGYNLTGNLSGRCPECGAPCTPTPE